MNYIYTIETQEFLAMKDGRTKKGGVDLYKRDFDRWLNGNLVRKDKLININSG